MSSTQLLAIYERLYCEGLATDTESRLLALALLNTSGLIIWDSPALADYDLALAHHAIPELAAHIRFMTDSSRIKNVLSSCFASLRIDDANCDMEILPTICQEWSRNAAEYFDNLAETKRLAANAQMLESLQRLLAVQYKNPSRYIKHLANWVIVATQAPFDLITVSTTSGKTEQLTKADYYRYILEFSGNVIKDSYSYEITTDSINELLDLMLDKLDYSNSFCFAASNLLKDLLASGQYHNSRGFQARYLKSLAIQEYLDMDTPLTEPVRSDYPEYKDYFLAKQKYICQQSALANKNDIGA
jgi:hypothetical protein